MRHIAILIFMCLPLFSQAQDTINPYNIGQPRTIYLQNTNAYYRPMAPPDSAHDKREWLSNQGWRLRDSNGVGNWGVYLPQKYDPATGQFVHLKDWAPYGTQLGVTGYWQRLFTASDKPGGAHSDIIAGDSVTDSIAHGLVTIDSLEDVDFRASGEIRLEDGFHAMPGSFFHAYIEPHWGDSVLSDDFDASVIDRSKWLVGDSASISGYANGPNCGYDSNVRLVSDPDAHDGHALDLLLRVDTAGCKCYDQSAFLDSCHENATKDLAHTYHFRFSNGILRACPFPYTDRARPVSSRVYDHAPYGKYEVRMKVPHIQYHMNNWGYSSFFEYDNEMYGVDDQLNRQYHTTLYRYKLFGPFKGVFVIGADTSFVSNAPDWCPSNNPNQIVIDRFPYQVKLKSGSTNTVVADGDGLYRPWPSSLLTGDSIFFYYSRSENNVSDSLPWSVTKDSAGKWRIFDGGYHDSSGHILRFSKDYQPSSIHLTYTFGADTSLACHWDSSINYPVDHGLLLLDDSMTSSWFHSGAQRYPYIVAECVNCHYSIPPVQLESPADSLVDSAYRYHTFTLELLPNEAEFLFDGNVVRRYPDRLVPTSDSHADWITTLARFEPQIYLGQMNLEIDTARFLSEVARRITSHYPGCSPVTIGDNAYDAAHELIDYVKIYDVPDDVKVEVFPR